MRGIMLVAVVVLAAASVWAAPKQAGYPFDGQTGFSVSNIQTVLKVDGFSVAAWVRVTDAVRPQMFLTLG